MSATVAAALKKIAVAVLTNKKLRRVVLGIILGIIIIVMMPMVVILSIFSGDIDIDSDRLQQIVVEEMSDEEKAKLQTVEDMMNAIESAMNEKGFTAERTKEAQVLYTLALYDYAKADNFVDTLVGCFTEDQTDEQLIAAVNAAFGTELKTEDYSKIMNSIRAKASRVFCFNPYSGGGNPFVFTYDEKLNKDYLMKGWRIVSANLSSEEETTTMLVVIERNI